jgi:hypothetical protein
MPNSGLSIEDALNPRLAGSTEGMTLQVLAQIRDSLSAQNRDIRNTVEAISDVRERVIRLEESNRRLEAVEKTTNDHNRRIDDLEADKLRRDGAIGLIGALKVWGPVVFSALAALWLFGRSLGITPAPPVRPIPVEATLRPEDLSIEGTVGGKPK